MFPYTPLSAQRLLKVRKHLTSIEDYIFGTNYNPFSDYSIYFITTNTNTQNLNTFQSSLALSEKKLKSKKLKDCYSYFTHEYYTKNGQHFHTHIILFKLKASRTAKRIGKKTLINFFFEKKHMKSKASIDIKEIKTLKSLEGRLIYIAGNKTADKDGNTYRDNELKIQFGIPLRSVYCLHPENHQQLKRYLTEHLEQN